MVTYNTTPVYFTQWEMQLALGWGSLETPLKLTTTQPPPHHQAPTLHRGTPGVLQTPEVPSLATSIFRRRRHWNKMSSSGRREEDCGMWEADKHPEGGNRRHDGYKAAPEKQRVMWVLDHHGKDLLGPCALSRSF